MQVLKGARKIQWHPTVHISHGRRSVRRLLGSRRCTNSDLVSILLAAEAFLLGRPGKMCRARRPSNVLERRVGHAHCRLRWRKLIVHFHVSTTRP